MKKTVLTIAVTLIVAVSASASLVGMMTTWVLVNDTCKKCRISDDVRYCGICKDETMYDHLHKSYKEGKHCVVEFVFKCKQCGHTSTWKAYD